MSGRDRIDGQERHATVESHRGDAHLTGQLLAMERPAEVDGQVALRDGALDRHRLTGGDGLIAQVERNDARNN